MKRVKGILLFPITAVILLIAALAEPTFGGEIAWLWWVVGVLGGFSVFGWALAKGRHQ